MPSENQLAAEFGASRSTVLKALSILRQDGWIESHQGRGHLVRGRPRGRVSPGYAREALGQSETAGVELLHVGPVLASAQIAAALRIPEGTPVYERRRRTVVEGEPVDLVHVFVPVEIAVGTEIAKPEPIPAGLLAHIELRKGHRGDYVEERLTCRAATPDEADVLAVSAGEPVLHVVLSVHEAAGLPLAAALLVMPGSRHEIEDAYPLR